VPPNWYCRTMTSHTPTLGSGHSTQFEDKQIKNTVAHF
jgi:hypothetical protein